MADSYASTAAGRIQAAFGVAEQPGAVMAKARQIQARYPDEYGRIPSMQACIVAARAEPGVAVVLFDGSTQGFADRVSRVNPGWPLTVGRDADVDAARVALAVQIAKLGSRP
jgi:hypothetical protein